MKQMGYLLALIIFMTIIATPYLGTTQEVFYPQVPFNILYAGGVEHTFIRIDHPQWDAIEFQTTSSGGLNLLITYLDGSQIHYLDQVPLVQLRKKFDTSLKPRDYRYAFMKYRSKIEKDGRVSVSFSADTETGRIEAIFISSGSLKEMNRVVDPLNHAMEVIPILYMEKTVLGGERTRVLLDGKPLKVKWDNVSFTYGANFGIIFRTDRREERLVQFRPGEKDWLGARWIYDLSGNRVTYNIEKEKDSEGYYEVKRIGNMIVQKAWLCPAKGGREVRRISTYSLVHENKEFIIEFDPPLCFPTQLFENQTLKTDLPFKAKISNSGWVVTGKVEMISWKVGNCIHSKIEFLPFSPDFLAQRPVYYKVVENPERYQVTAKERK